MAIVVYPIYDLVSLIHVLKFSCSRLPPPLEIVGLSMIQVCVLVLSIPCSRLPSTPEIVGLSMIQVCVLVLSIPCSRLSLLPFVDYPNLLDLDGLRLHMTKDLLAEDQCYVLSKKNIFLKKSKMG